MRRMAVGAPTQPTPPRRLRSDILLMGVNKAVVLGVGVASSIIIARALGPSGRGSLAVAVALTAILVQLGSLGFQTANPYFVTQPGVSARTLVINSLWLAAGLGLVTGTLAVALKLLAPATVAGLSWSEVLIAAATVPVMLAMLFLQSILLGQGRTVP